MGAEVHTVSAPVGPTEPGRTRRIRLPSAFIALAAGALVAVALCSDIARECGVVAVLGLAMAGCLALATCFALAELRSTAPFSGGAWHFARMVYGVQGGFMLAWLEVLAMATTAALFGRTAWELSGRAGATMALEGFGGSAVSVGGYFLLGLPVALPLIVWMSLSPTTLRRTSMWWRRSLKWFSYIALTVGWGVTVAFAVSSLSGERTYLPPRVGADIPRGFAMGLLTALVCFCSVMHSVPGDATDAESEGRSNAQGEHRRYRLPRGMLLGVLVCVVTAAMLALAAISVAQPHGAGAGQGGTRYDLSLIVATWVAAVGGMFFATARSVRVLSAMTREGMLPLWLSNVPARTRRDGQRSRPRYGATATALIAAVLFGIQAPTWQASALTAGLLHAFLGAATCFCQIRVRREIGDEVDYGFVLPGFPWVPWLAGLGMLGAAGLILCWFPSTVFAGSVFVVSGLLLHEFYARIHSLSRSEDVVALEEGGGKSLSEPSRQSLRVLVAAGDAATADRLLRVAQRLCGRRPTVMGLLHMVTVPESVRISEAMRDVSQARDMVLGLSRKFATEGLELRPSLRYCRSAARGILTTVRESRTDLLLLGWHGRLHRGRSTAWGRTLDPVLRRAPCNVVVAKGLPEVLRFRRILVPIVERAHSAFALNVASRLADETDDAQIEVFGVHGFGVDDIDVREFLQKHVRRVARPTLRVLCRSEVYGSVVEGILEEILRGEHDVVVLGATPPPQASIGDGTIASQVAARCHVPCIMVSAVSGPMVWRNRWLRSE